MSIRLRRIRDIMGAIFGLAIFSPLFVYAMILIKRDSPGPIIFRGIRAGKNGKKFRIYKFRTMYETPESYSGPGITAEDDPRITPAGKKLRRTKINELPQLLNVLFGDMSLVGPRPENIEIVQEWPEKIKNEILSVRPGITSPASVLFRDEEKNLQHDDVMGTYLGSIQPTKLRLDQLYVRNRSFWSDLDVLIWTTLVLLPMVTIEKPKERHLFAGPIFFFRHRLINWFTIDFLVALASFAFVGFMWRYFEPLKIGLENAILISLGYALLFTLDGYLLGIQNVFWSKASATDVLDIFVASLLSGAIAIITNYFFDLLPYTIIISASILAFFGFVATRFRTRIISGMLRRLLHARGDLKIAKEKVLIVGCGDAGQLSAWMLQNTQDAKHYHIVGFVDDDLFKIGTRLRGIRVLGGSDQIENLVAKHDIGMILFAIHNIDSDTREVLLKKCRMTSAKTVNIPNIFAQIKKSSPNEDQSIITANGKSHSVLISELRSWYKMIDRRIENGNLEELKNSLREFKDNFLGEEK